MKIFLAASVLLLAMSGCASAEEEQTKAAAKKQVGACAEYRDAVVERDMMTAEERRERYLKIYQLAEGSDHGMLEASAKYVVEALTRDDVIDLLKGLKALKSTCDQIEASQ